MARNDPTVLTEHAFRELRREYYAQKRQISNLTNRLTEFSKRQSQGAKTPHGRVRFKNTSDETVPAWAVMQMTTGGTSDYINIQKQDSNFHGLHLVNGGSGVASGAYGVGHFLTAEVFTPRRQFALYNTAATPAIGQSWGPVEDSWLLHQHGPGFYVIGGTKGSGSTARVKVLQVPPAEILVKNNTGGDIAAGATGVCSVYGGASGSEADSGLTVTARNKTSIAFKNTKFGAVGFLNGQAYVVPFET